MSCYFICKPMGADGGLVHFNISFNISITEQAKKDVLKNSRKYEILRHSPFIYKQCTALHNPRKGKRAY